ncbi:hypothetical protein D3C87_269410 [compost metagenome]
MKRLIYSLSLALLALTFFTGCKKETRSSHPTNYSTSGIDGKWNLMRVYGGIMGANETHSDGEIEWTFNTQNMTLNVNNTSGNSGYYYLPSGTYNFQEISNSNGQYLVIDANELGEFVISGNRLLIDENKKSSGEGACGFYMELER